MQYGSQYGSHNVRPGMDIYSSDNQKIGTVDQCFDDYCLVKKGLIFTKDLYIPFTSFSRCEADRCFVNVPKDRVEQMNWFQPPTSGTSGTRLGM